MKLILAASSRFVTSLWEIVSSIFIILPWMLLLSSAASSISLAISHSSFNLSNIWLSKTFNVSSMSYKVTTTAFNFPLISRISGPYLGTSSSATLILLLAVVLCQFLECFNLTDGSVVSYVY